MFYDGQMDDARLGLALAKTAVDQGALVLNYCEVTELHHGDSGRVTGLTFHDRLSSHQSSDLDKEDQDSSNPSEYIRVNAKVIINATGVFTDKVRSLENTQLKALVRPSQGAHVVLPKRFLPEDNGVVFPETPDGRVLFAVPWYERVLVGTTDVYRGEVDDEPAPLEEEIDFILGLAQEHFKEAPQTTDILSVFAGLRPLVAPPEDSERKTSKISREHDIRIGAGGVFHITGGKWTTYRKMAEDMITAVVKEGLLPHQKCVTAQLKLVGWAPSEGALDVESVYGSEIEEIHALCQRDVHLSEPLHPDLPYLKAHVIFAVRHELAMTISDVLSRRTRALLLDAQSALDAAPEVAKLLAAELGKDELWIDQQIQDFTELAQRYMWSSIED
jgi:glycerol-3-phosphate dehydrogenase